MKAFKVKDEDKDKSNQLMSFRINDQKNIKPLKQRLN